MAPVQTSAVIVSAQIEPYIAEAKEKNQILLPVSIFL